MVLERIIGQTVLTAVLLVASPAALSAAPEPLVVTKLADPDPNYVPLRTTGSSSQISDREAEADAKVDSAMESFGRVIGQAAIIEQQQIQAQCRSGAPVNATPEQRFDYEASCRYSRH